jgi:hypothetical protein
VAVLCELGSEHSDYIKLGGGSILLARYVTISFSRWDLELLFAPVIDSFFYVNLVFYVLGLIWKFVFAEVS